MTSTYTADVHRAEGSMLHALAQNWWLFLLRGLCAIVFGVLAFVWPGATLLTLVLLYGGFALVDGVASIVTAIKGGSLTSRWWLAIIGGLGIVAGILTLYWPGLTALALLLFIAVWAIATVIGAYAIAQGILTVAFSWRLRRHAHAANRS